MGTLPAEQLYQALIEHFNEEELRGLCFQLDVKYDQLGGESTLGKSRELVTYLQRRNKLSELEAKIRESRPDVTLGSPSQAASPAAASVWAPDAGLKPVIKREFQTLLCSAQVDDEAVQAFHGWLKDASIPVWYDRKYFPAGGVTGQDVQQALAKCRSIIILLSNSTMASGWAREQYDIAAAHKAYYQALQIIPVVVDEIEPPDFVESSELIQAPAGRLAFESAAALLGAIYHHVAGQMDKTRDVFVSRGWRHNELAMAKYVCEKLDQAGFKLIADYDDHESFDANRLKRIISSCGGMVAIAPDRGRGETSKYILQEIEYAAEVSVPTLIIAEPGVILPEAMREKAVFFSMESRDRYETDLEDGMEDLSEMWREPALPHGFYATSFANWERIEVVKNLARLVTSLRWEIGYRTSDQQGAQNEITRMIQRSYLLMADISGRRNDVLIEIGIARGADVELKILEQDPHDQRPFMLRDKSLGYYADDVDLLAEVHSAVYPFRRQVLNYEL